MSNSILKDTINFIPSTSEDILEDDVYKSSILLSINNALATLKQNSVGKTIDLFENEVATWDDFFGSDFTGDKAPAKMFVYLRTQLEFDPPQSSVQTMFEAKAEEALYRARLEGEISKCLTN